MKKILLHFVFATMLLALGACNNSEADVLSTVPADVPVIVRINADAILTSAGCINENGKWRPGTAVENLLEQMISTDRKEFENILATAEYIDRENIFIMVYDRHTTMMVCRLLNASAISAGLEKEFGKPESVNGFKAYGHIFVRDNFLWIAESAPQIKSILDKASKESAVTSKAISKYFEKNADGAILAALNVGQLPKAIGFFNAAASLSGYENSVQCFCLKFNGNTARLDGGLYDEFGEPYSPAGMVEEINGSFSKFIPANAMIAMVLGRPTEALLKLNMDKMPDYTAELINPYFEAITGASALSVTPPADIKQLLDISKWNITLSIDYQQKKAEECISDLYSILDSQGMTVVKSGNALKLNLPQNMTAPFPHDYYMEYTDGALVVSTAPIVAKPNKAIADDFAGNYGAGMVNLPAKGEIAEALALPFGLKSEMKSNDKEAYITVSLDGSPNLFIESIIDVIGNQALQRRVAERVMQLQNQ